MKHPHDGNGLLPDTAALRRLLEAGRRDAALLRQFRPVLQPMLALDSGRCVGAEVLMRWRLPDGTDIPPERFIPIARHAGALPALSRQVFVQAATAVARVGLPAEFHMSFNVPAGYLLAPAFPAHLEELDGILPAHAEIWIELTEDEALPDTQAALRRLASLRRGRIRIGVDDFGTGFNDIDSLARVRPDFLKLDQSLIAALGTPAENRAIFDVARYASQRRGVRVVAEGIENVLQVVRLRELGIQDGQGYFFDQPMSLEAFAMWLPQVERRAAAQL
ncbi:EAL domain-containing protein [Bordetella genomosp. 1]|uniref:EAL domain-containing protein n=1 Tax=Bordetella genomosp. 1 TaxID=1395607 RepID=UPI0015954C82|nr:EAL domain-containing protein [Bordetella genomosp. 1]